MKSFTTFLLSLFFCAGCVSNLTDQEVTFTYVNLSTNEIWVVNVVGLPEWAHPGRLIPVKSENPLSESSMTSFETVRVKDRIKIVWKDNGTHEAEFSRDELGIPAKLKGEKVDFTYLGADKWRVRLFKSP